MEDVKIIQQLLDVMEMQENRENGSFHIPQEVAWHLWCEAKQKARDYIEININSLT